MVSYDAQLMEFLRSKHPTMAQVLEVVLGDIGGFSTYMPVLPVFGPVLSCCFKSCRFLAVHRLLQSSLLLSE